MTLEEFTNQVQSARIRAQSLLHIADNLSANAPTDLASSLQELEVAFEELRVADEELHEQNEELSEARSQLEMERHRYHDLFEFAPDGYLVTQLDGAILEANRAASALLGISAHHLIGKPLPIYVSSSERRTFRARLIHLPETSGIEQWESVLQPRNRGSFQAAFSVTVIRNRDGGPIGLRWLFRDTTAHRRAEEGQHRAEFLATASYMLASSADYEQLLEQAAQVSVPLFADLCIIHLRGEDGQIERVLVAHADPEQSKKLALVERKTPLDLSSLHPAAFVLRTGKRHFSPRVHDELLVKMARHPQELERLRALDLRSLIALPLRAHGRLLGAITFGASGKRTYKPADLGTADSLARQVALMMHNARRYEPVGAGAEVESLRDRLAAGEYSESLNEIADLARRARQQSPKLTPPEVISALDTIERLACELEERIRMTPQDAAS